MVDGKGIKPRPNTGGLCNGIDGNLDRTLFNSYLDQIKLGIYNSATPLIPVLTNIMRPVSHPKALHIWTQHLLRLTIGRWLPSHNPVKNMGYYKASVRLSV
jgi:hypothetical protein